MKSIRSRTAMLPGRKLFRMQRWMFSRRRASSVSRGTASGSSVEKICIWNQSETLVHPAAAQRSARNRWSSVGPGLYCEALSL
jgi:hypothetical protein